MKFSYIYQINKHIKNKLFETVRKLRTYVRTMYSDATLDIIEFNHVD